MANTKGEAAMTKGEMVEVLTQGLQFVAEDDYDMAIENVQTFE